MDDHKLAYKNLLRQYFNIDDGLKGIEIGCLKGEFDAFLFFHIPKLHMITIDPSAWWPVVLAENHDFINRFHILPVTSDVAADILYSVYNNTFDFVFIDGEHSYEQTRRDILNYMRLVKKGGLISGHNFGGNTHPGVEKAVKEIFGDKFKLTETDCVWYVSI